MKIEYFFPMSAPEHMVVDTIQTFTDDKKGLHPKGLFSTEIFGQVGSPERMKREGIIDLKVPMIHVDLYNILMSYDKMYKDILSGKVFATFNNKTGHFEISDMETGQTGFEFFMTHIHELKFNTKTSKKGKAIEKLLKRWRGVSNLINTKLIVLPAGLRDIQVEDNRVVKQEINDIYTQIINLSNMMGITNDLKSIDMYRFYLQETLAKLDNYIYQEILKGKKKLVNGGWASRNVEYGTGNVIVGDPEHIDDLDKAVKDNENFDVTSLPLFQFLKSIEPIAINSFTKMIGIYLTENDTVIGYDSETDEYIHKEISNDIYLKFTTYDGINEIINTLVNTDALNSNFDMGGVNPILVSDNGNEIDVCYDADTFARWKNDKVKYRPITTGELFFLSVYKIVHKFAGTLTRHPVIGRRSIIPTKIKLRTTVRDRDVKFNNEGIVKTYPYISEIWQGAMSIDYTRVSGFTADYDGDKMYVMLAFTDDALAELNNLIDSVKNYIGLNGKPILDLDDKISNFTHKFLTK